MSFERARNLLTRATELLRADDPKVTKDPPIVVTNGNDGGTGARSEDLSTPKALK